MTARKAALLCAASALAALAYLFLARMTRPETVTVIRELDIAARLPPPPKSALSGGDMVGAAAQPPAYTNEILFARLQAQQKRQGMRILKRGEAENAQSGQTFTQRIKEVLDQLAAMRRSVSGSSGKKEPTAIGGATAQLIDTTDTRAGSTVDKSQNSGSNP